MSSEHDLVAREPEEIEVFGGKFGDSIIGIAVKTLARIAGAVVIGVLLIASVTLLLFVLPSPIALVVAIAGVGMLTATKFLHKKWLAGVGAVLAFGGVLAYALRVPI